MPISDCAVRDPRIRRTRQLLQQALRNLMQTKNFDEISVQDITEAATVNRATFYDHYTDKFTLLDAMVAGGFHALLNERNISFDGTCPSAAEAIILATCDYLTQTHSETTTCSRQSHFAPLMEAAIVTAIHRVLQGSSDSSTPPLPAMTASAVSWAIYGSVKEWFYTPDRPSAAEIVPSILQLILPMLKTANSDPHPGTAAYEHGKIDSST